MDGKLDMNQKCTVVGRKANPIQDCITRNVASRWKKMTLPLSAPARAHLEFSVRNNVDLLENIQRKATKTIQGMTTPL